jgi:hypothetical protein
MTDPRIDDRALAEGLRTIAEEDARLGASPAVEAQVMAACAAVAAARRRRIRMAVASFGAVAALVAVAVMLRPWLRSTNSRPASDSRLQTSPGEVTTAFMPLAYSGVPVADAHVVRMEVPRASLVSFGLLPAEGAEGGRSGTVLADVIVGDDGLARAVRFVRKSDRKEPRR